MEYEHMHVSIHIKFVLFEYFQSESVWNLSRQKDNVTEWDEPRQRKDLLKRYVGAIFLKKGKD